MVFEVVVKELVTLFHLQYVYCSDVKVNENILAVLLSCLRVVVATIEWPDITRVSHCGTSQTIQA